MITRNEVLGQAVDQCMKELYSFATPKVSWEKFIEENKIYSKLYQEWEAYNKASDEVKKGYNEKLDWKGKSMTECIGPRPYEFYYLPAEIFKDICNSYIYAYGIDQQQELLDTIDTLKNYCKEPIVDKWIEGENGFPGYRGYEHPDNLEKNLSKYFASYFEEEDGLSSELAKSCQNKFFEFLDMAGGFYNWNSELNSFNQSVYLGASPCSNKEAVIKNWKEYRKQDIEIDENKIRENYYGEELD